MKNPKDDDSIEDISSSAIDVDNDIQIAQIANQSNSEIMPLGVVEEQNDEEDPEQKEYK